MILLVCLTYFTVNISYHYFCLGLKLSWCAFPDLTLYGSLPHVRNFNHNKHIVTRAYCRNLGRGHPVVIKVQY